ncbi:MAG: enoyl-CoA hydratase/carnithine racemase [Bradymonadia bacterium]|jgi:enoyl-CoA hydratase/carnithine racemase
MTTPRITTELAGNVFRIGLDRPAKYNAFDLQMLSELAEAYTEFEDTPEARCALLFAPGKHFTAGLDLAEVGPAVARGDALFPEGAVDPLNLFGRRRKKPVVVAVQGYCFTIGMELALAADIVVAAANTTFGQIEVQRGIMPFGGATLRMHEQCGWGNAMRYLLTGDKFDGVEAHRIGFVQELRDSADEVRERGNELAATVAAQAPLAVVASRMSARLACEEGAAAAVSVLMTEARELMTTNDASEGVRSFIERRAAKFTGS